MRQGDRSAAGGHQLRAAARRRATVTEIGSSNGEDRHQGRCDEFRDVTDIVATGVRCDLAENEIGYWEQCAGSGGPGLVGYRGSRARVGGTAVRFDCRRALRRLCSTFTPSQ